MSMLETLPSMEEMIAALSSPMSPTVSNREDSMELSTDDMIREIFSMMTEHRYGGAATGSGVRARDSSYNSSTDTYDGLPTPSQYNGDSI